MKGTISQAFILLKSADPIAYLLTLQEAQILSSYKFNNEHYRKLFNLIVVAGITYVRRIVIMNTYETPEREKINRHT
jgi:hypothetical protein